MNILSQKVLGMTFKNPILPASGTFNMGREVDSFFFPINTLGGLISKGLSHFKCSGNPAPRCTEVYGGMLNSVGLQGPGIEEFIKTDLPFMKTHNIPVIVNVWGRTKEDYIKVIELACKEKDIDAIELNVSCPNIKCGGLSFGVDPVAVQQIVEAVRPFCTKPLIVKLTPNVANIAENAKAAERGGADAISLINTVSGMAVDIETRKPILGNRVGGLSGPCIKPIALKMVWDVYNAVKIPIIGCGGISNVRDVIEFILCGATLVQVGTLLMTDPMEVPKIISELELWCQEHNIKSLNELRGKLIT